MRPSDVGGVLVLIPTYNEGDNIYSLIQGIMDQGCIDWILIVDDSSTDGTLKVLSHLQGKYDNLFVHQRPEALGLGSALRDGFRLALHYFPFSRLVQMDGDFSHDPAYIPKMLESPANFIVGSRYIDGSRIVGWNAYRKLVSRGANFLARALLGLKVRDVTSGFRVYSRRAVKFLAWESTCKGYDFQVEAVWLAKEFRVDIQEIPITFTDRFHGKSKLKGVSEVMKLLTLLLKNKKTCNLKFKPKTNI